MNKTKQEKVESRHTVREVFDSCYFETVDCDGNKDGFLHIISTINGAEIKIPLDELQTNPLTE